MNATMKTTNTPQSVKTTLRTITIIHMAFCVFIFLIGFVVLYITENATLNFSDSEDRLLYIVPVLAITAIIVSQYLFKKNIAQAHNTSNLEEKIMQYQTSKLIQYALIEAPAFLAIVKFMSTSNHYYLIISAILLVYLISRKPTTSEIKNNLNFSAEQEREFRNLTT